MKKIKISWIIIVILIIIIAIFVYKFTAGSVTPSDDGRQAVILTKDERNMILLEMRTWLQSTQGVLKAAINNDLEEVATVARVSGMAAEALTPGSLFRKIPLPMKKLGFGTRSKFDEIAVMAENKVDNKKIIKFLSDTMTNCIACHASYRLVEEKSK